MGLQIIGAGWGRTGTTSLKCALEQLGFCCHHMSEVDDDANQQKLFSKAADEPIEWDRIYADYTATVDWPGCAFWRELREAYPQARVLLTVRDFDDWYASWRATIYRALTTEDPQRSASWSAMVDAVITRRSFGGRIVGRDHVKAMFDEHIRAVRDAVPPSELLVFDVRQGWHPLCQFLERDVPKSSFPHLNPKAEW